ncbi:MAG: radical SAM protein [Candidatus Omnitrophica bacterium]|nr:radical SAM protein [Candidatus Omnitrophota bacterium]
MMRLLKNTRSLLPGTLQLRDCGIFEEEGNILLVKGEGAQERHIIERDTCLYKKMDIAYGRRAPGFDRVMIDVTTRCNLKCSVCYREPDSAADMDIRKLGELAQQFRGKIISICGGEPTMRPDLPQIIRLFSKKNTVFLITNGIKLSQYDYLRELHASGLRYVSFSLNGLSEEALAAINEEGILAQKLSALANLKRLRVKTVLAVVLAKGVNEKELPQIFDFCLQNRDYIEELRIRAMAPLGAHLAGEKLCISEMIDTVTRAFGISKECVLREFEVKRAVNTLCRREIFSIKSCTFDFHLKTHRGRVYPAGEDITEKIHFPPQGLRQKIRVFRSLLKLYGPAMLIAGVFKSARRAESIPWFHSGGLFKIGLRSWPDINTIDLEENSRCRTGYWLDGRFVSFCYANILKDASRCQRHV